MEFNPDSQKTAAYYLWCLFPLAVGVLCLFMDTTDGFISFYTIGGCFLLGLASYIFCRALYSQLSFSLIVERGFVCKENGFLATRINWSDVNSIFFVEYSLLKLFKVPYLEFTCKFKDQSLVYSILPLSQEDIIKLLTYVKDLADKNSIEVNYTIQL